MADGTKISNGTEYVGLEYGLENPGVLETLLSGIDERIIYDGTQQGGWIATYSEVCFAMAEAHVKRVDISRRYFNMVEVRYSSIL